MSTQATVRDYPTEIRQAKASTQVLAGHRDRLIREEATEAQKVKEAQSKLTELGIADVDQMTLADLTSLEVSTRAGLDKQLAEIQEQIAAGEEVMKAYTAVAE